MHMEVDGQQHLPGVPAQPISSHAYCFLCGRDRARDTNEQGGASIFTSSLQSVENFCLPVGFAPSYMTIFPVMHGTCSNASRSRSLGS
jgi:hypothetical protein